MSQPEEHRETVVEQPRTRVVEEPSSSYVERRDPVATSIAASRLIQTVVWSAVVIVILVVGIILLVHYKIL
jgi:hypothetical protein